MLDLRFVRENPEKVKQSVIDRGGEVDLEQLLDLDKKRRECIKKADRLKEKRNKVSEEIGNLKKAGKDGSSAIAEMRKVSQEIKGLDESIKTIESQIHDILIWIPNIPHDSVPRGPDPSYNEIVKEWGSAPRFDFQPKPHWEIGSDLEILDFERGSRLSGANFVSYAGLGAKLERALINFMIDLHAEKHGYSEVSVPFIVKRDMMYGTGQLPKLEEDMYLVEKDDLSLIPTISTSSLV